MTFARPPRSDDIRRITSGIAETLTLMLDPIAQDAGHQGAARPRSPAATDHCVQIAAEAEMMMRPSPPSCARASATGTIFLHHRDLLRIAHENRSFTLSNPMAPDAPVAGARECRC